MKEWSKFEKPRKINFLPNNIPLIKYQKIFSDKYQETYEELLNQHIQSLGIDSIKTPEQYFKSLESRELESDEIFSVDTRQHIRKVLERLQDLLTEEEKGSFLEDWFTDAEPAKQLTIPMDFMPSDLVFNWLLNTSNTTLRSISDIIIDIHRKALIPGYFSNNEKVVRTIHALAKKGKVNFPVNYIKECIEHGTDDNVFKIQLLLILQREEEALRARRLFSGNSEFWKKFYPKQAPELIPGTIRHFLNYGIEQGLEKDFQKVLAIIDSAKLEKRKDADILHLYFVSIFSKLISSSPILKKTYEHYWSVQSAKEEKPNEFWENVHIDIKTSRVIAPSTDTVTTKTNVGKIFNDILKHEEESSTDFESLIDR